MKASFIIAVLVAAFTSSAALADIKSVSNNAAIKCTKQMNDQSYASIVAKVEAQAAKKVGSAKN